MSNHILFLLADGFEETECVGMKEHAYVEKTFPERMASFKK